MEPVAPEIIDMVRRLHATGQLEQITRGSEASGPPVPVLPTAGSMHDGSKRRLFDDEEYKSAEFEVVEPPSKVSAGKVEQAIIPPKSVQVEKKTSGALPEGVTSVIEWGDTVCTLPKYKSGKYTYAAMISVAKTDDEIQDYLKWAKTAGMKSAKLDDLRAYMVAIGFDPVTDGAKPPKVTYPGTSIPHEF